MKINITIIVVALLLVTGAAHSTSITSLEITGGSFSINGTNDTLNPAAFANMTVGGYDGSEPATVGDQVFYAPTSIATAEFDQFGPIAIHTSETDGIRSGFSALSGDVTGNSLTLDLSSWTMYWNGQSHNLGSSSDYITGSICSGAIQVNCTTSILTTYDALTGEFTASWNAVVVGGAIPDALTTWEITGVVSTVPVPAAVWLFGCGLLGLVGFAKRKKI